MTDSDSPLRALALNCTLKASPVTSNTDALTEQLLAALRKLDVETETTRVVDHDIRPGVTSDEGNGDEWPALRERILDADILILAGPTWVGQPSSIAKRVIERMDAMISETDEEERPVAYNRVAGFVVVGNEDGAHHVIAELAGALIDIGYTVPGQAWTYWNKGPGPGEDYLETDEGHEWSRTTAQAAAANLAAVAGALRGKPMPAPPS